VNYYVHNYVHNKKSSVFQKNRAFQITPTHLLACPRAGSLFYIGPSYVKRKKVSCPPMPEPGDGRRGCSKKVCFGSYRAQNKPFQKSFPKASPFPSLSQKLGLLLKERPFPRFLFFYFLSLSANSLLLANSFYIFIC